MQSLADWEENLGQGERHDGAHECDVGKTKEEAYVCSETSAQMGGSESILEYLDFVSARLLGLYRFGMGELSTDQALSH